MKWVIRMVAGIYRERKNLYKITKPSLNILEEKFMENNTNIEYGYIERSSVKL